MIPKIIHYCWFGKNPKPQSALTCIESWKKFFPDYQIIEWNETNFDYTTCKYSNQAYDAKKWAFVSDYARFKILYENGGVYFDTDVEVIKDMRDILQKGPFMACEAGHALVKESKFDIAINPGLGLAAPAGHDFYKEVLNYYCNELFLNPDGTNNTTTIVARITDILTKKNVKLSKNISVFEGIYIYPEEFFCPMNYVTGELHITENTRTIHHYTESWMNNYEKQIAVINRFFAQRNVILKQIGKIIILPIRILNKIYKFKKMIKV